MSTNEERQELINDLKSKFGEYVEKYFEAFDSAGKRAHMGCRLLLRLRNYGKKPIKKPENC